MKLVTLEQIFSKLKRKSSYDPINRKETVMSYDPYDDEGNAPLNMDGDCIEIEVSDD